MTEAAAKVVCSGCNERLPINEFGFHQRNSGSTIPCHAAAIREMKEPQS